MNITGVKVWLNKNQSEELAILQEFLPTLRWRGFSQDYFMTKIPKEGLGVLIMTKFFTGCAAAVFYDSRLLEVDLYKLLEYLEGEE